MSGRGIRKTFITLPVLLFIICVSGFFCNAGAASVSGFSDLEHKRIGVTTGSIQAIQAEERFPDASFFYYSTTVDLLNALRADKIDAFADAEALAKYMMAENPDLAILDEKLSDGMKAGAIFPKTAAGRKLCDEFSAFIREIKKNGVYDEIQDTWFGDDEEKRTVPDPGTLPAPNGTLRMAADPS